MSSSQGQQRQRHKDGGRSRRGGKFGMPRYDDLLPSSASMVPSSEDFSCSMLTDTSTHSTTTTSSSSSLDDGSRSYTTSSRVSTRTRSVSTWAPSRATHHNRTKRARGTDTATKGDHHHRHGGTEDDYDDGYYHHHHHHHHHHHDDHHYAGAVAGDTADDVDYSAETYNNEEEEEALRSGGTGTIASFSYRASGGRRHTGNATRPATKEESTSFASSRPSSAGDAQGDETTTASSTTADTADSSASYDDGKEDSGEMTAYSSSSWRMPPGSTDECTRGHHCPYHHHQQRGHRLATSAKAATAGDEESSATAAASSSCTSAVDDEGATTDIDMQLGPHSAGDDDESEGNHHRRRRPEKETRRRKEAHDKKQSKSDEDPSSTSSSSSSSSFDSLSSSSSSSSSIASQFKTSSSSAAVEAGRHRAGNDADLGFVHVGCDEPVRIRTCHRVSRHRRGSLCSESSALTVGGGATGGSRTCPAGVVETCAVTIAEPVVSPCCPDGPHAVFARPRCPQRGDAASGPCPSAPIVVAPGVTDQPEGPPEPFEALGATYTLLAGSVDTRGTLEVALVSLPAGVSQRPLVSKGADVAFTFISGTGAIAVNGRTYPVAPTAFVYVRAGSSFAVANTQAPIGGAPLVFTQQFLNAAGGLGFYRDLSVYEASVGGPANTDPRVVEDIAERYLLFAPPGTSARGPSAADVFVPAGTVRLLPTPLCDPEADGDGDSKAGGCCEPVDSESWGLRRFQMLVITAVDTATTPTALAPRPAATIKPKDLEAFVHLAPLTPLATVRATIVRDPRAGSADILAEPTINGACTAVLPTGASYWVYYDECANDVIIQAVAPQSALPTPPPAPTV